MKLFQRKHFLLILPLFLLMSGCGTIHFDVSPHSRVKLLEQDIPTTVKVDRKIWYALWGNINLNNNHTAPIIDEYCLKEVKLFNEQSTWDSIINFFAAFFSFSRRTMTVEGNPSTQVLDSSPPYLVCHVQNPHGGLVSENREGEN